MAVAGVDMTFHADHLRKKELEEIAEAVGAELILLKAPKDGKVKEDEIEIKE